MKDEQSSVYRHLEMLHLWCIDTLDNAPKNPCVQEDVRILVNAVVEAQVAVHWALMTEALSQRLDFLDVVVMNMTKVKTITKVLSEYSSDVERGKHVISKKGRVRLLDIMSQIGNELGRWRNSTICQMTKSKAADTLPN